MDYRLTEKPKKYCWNHFGDFSYTDWDYATLDTSGKMSRREKRIDLCRPRQTITYKDNYYFTFEFNDFGDMTKAKISAPKTMSEYEKEHRIQDVISLMIENDLIENAFEE